MPKLNGFNIIYFPEAYCAMCITLVIGIMQAGLIPTNKQYDTLFTKSSVSAIITDRSGNPVYRSESADDITPELFAATDRTRISAHTILHRAEIPGGYGFWREDVTEPDRVNDELAETRSRLSEEAELIRLQNELKEKRSRIEQRSIVYDSITARTERQTALIDALMKQAASAGNPAEKTIWLNRIILLSAYIKRFAYLMLIQSESGWISSGDLGLSVSELLRYLNQTGISAELFNTAVSQVPSDGVLVLFEAFEELLESNFNCLKGVLINISEKEEHIIFKAILEGATLQLSQAITEKLHESGIGINTEPDDDTLYISFSLGKGGAVK